ncbi:MAG: hypothetical protein IPG76_11740 [Acidobacteria bacterium]|nr:hypothetical protein [Acidobacteriota bacterium]
MPTVLINPLNEAVNLKVAPAARLSRLAGTKIGLLDISKPGGSVFLDRIEHLLKERFGVKDVIRVTKPTFTKPAPADVIDILSKAGCDGVIEALAD